ncbi:MAG: hypothetical protein QME25_08340, partial [Bacteroidota bacterium]|nr:hypothetical protein [Bacteroidota bacterium]
YELSMSTQYTSWNYTHGLAQGGFVDIIGVSNPLKYLFYTSAQIAGHFPSNDVGGNNSFGINEPFSNYPPLETFINSLGSPPNTINVTQIANTAFVYSIRATAGLLYWFAMETDLLQNTLVQNSFGGGNVRVNSTVYPNGYRIPAWNPQTTTLEAIDQVFDGCNWRFQNWQKIVNGNVVQTFTSRSITITPEANTTYKAVFIQPLSVTILGVTSHLPNAPQTFEASVPGNNSSVSYKWDVMNPCCLTKRNSIEKLPVCDIWNGLGTIGTNQQIEYTDGYNYILKVVVSDGFRIAEDYHDVTVGQCITGGGSSGCPFVYTLDGSAWVEDNNVLPTSEFLQNVGRDVTDYYKLHQPLARRDGNYVLQLRELDDEHSFLDQEMEKSSHSLHRCRRAQHDTEIGM